MEDNVNMFCYPTKKITKMETIKQEKVQQIKKQIFSTALKVIY